MAGGIGYKKAKALVKRYGWELHVTMREEIFQKAEAHAPDGHDVLTVRRDSAKRLIPEYVVSGRVDDETAILSYKPEDKPEENDE